MVRVLQDLRYRQTILYVDPVLAGLSLFLVSLYESPPVSLFGDDTYSCSSLNFGSLASYFSGLRKGSVRWH